MVDAKCNWTKPPFATLRVTAVEVVRRDELRGPDATADGFESVREMLDWLDHAYGELAEFTRISFEVVDVDLSGT